MLEDKAIDKVIHSSLPDIQWVLENTGIDVNTTSSQTTSKSNYSISLSQLAELGEKSVGLLDEYLVSTRLFRLRSINKLLLSEKLLIVALGCYGQSPKVSSDEKNAASLS